MVAGQKIAGTRRQDVHRVRVNARQLIVSNACRSLLLVYAAAADRLRSSIFVVDWDDFFRLRGASSLFRHA